MLRSRALGAALAKTAPTSQKSMFAKPQRTWRQAIRNNYFTQQLGKFGRKIRQVYEGMISIYFSNLLFSGTSPNHQKCRQAFQRQLEVLSIGIGFSAFGRAHLQIPTWTSHKRAANKQASGWVCTTAIWTATQDLRVSAVGGFVGQMVKKSLFANLMATNTEQAWICSEYLLKTQEALEQARQKYLTSNSNPTQTSPMDTQQSATPPPKPTRSPHLTDTL